MNRSTLQRILSIVVPVLLLANFLLFYSDSFNPYKRAYQKELENQRKASEARVAELRIEINLLDARNQVLQGRADSIDNLLTQEEAKRKRERDEYNRKMAELGRLSNAELARYFAERYSR